MSEYILRGYQNQAIDETLKYIRAGLGNPVIAAPTGVGKAGCIAGLIKKLLFDFPRLRILVVSHVKELVQQDSEELLKLWTTAPTAIYSSGLGKKEIGQVTFAGIGSICNKAELFGKIDLVIIDEAHSVNANETTTYVKFLKKLEESNKYLKVVGLSATCYRLGHGLITENHPIFNGFSIDLTSFEWFNWFISEGYLAELTSKKTATQLDVSGVKITAGDYNQKQLAEAVDKIEVTREALKEAVAYGHDRISWICFATSIEHVIHITEMLNEEFGIPSVAIHSKMTSEERDAAIQDFKDMKYRCAVNMMVLSTGTNIPQLDMLIDLAPTTSTSRYIQRYGRLTRPVYASGYDLTTREGRLAAIVNGSKSRGALCLDFAGTISRLGCINDPVIPRKKGEGKGGQAPVRTCDACQTISHPSVRECPCCGKEFPIQVKITHTASNKDIIAKEKIAKADLKTPKPPHPDIPDSWYPVQHIEYKRQNTKSGDMLKVTYNPSLLGATEFVGFDHPDGSWQRGASFSWWNKRISGKCPRSIDEVLKYVDQLPKPARILVSQKGKFLNVKKVEFGDDFVISRLIEKEREFDEGEVIYASEYDDIPF
jgi:DNA repair protein RadD